MLTGGEDSPTIDGQGIIKPAEDGPIFRQFFLLLAACVIASPASGDDPVALPDACSTECRTPYGKVLGRTPSGIEAYSNCGAACVVFDPHRHDGTYTGIRWQCVEFARRWLLVRRGAVFGDVDVAADLWHDITWLQSVHDDATFGLENMLNGSPSPPRDGDLLVYGREFLGTGHVAVVIGVDLEAGVVRVAEQNYRNEPWPSSHAREIPLVEKAGLTWLLDPHLVGWKRITE